MSEILKLFVVQASVSKETYQTISSLVASSCCIVHGFIITQSDLLITSESFQQRNDYSDSTFFESFITVFFIGELFGALFSFLVSDGFGRTNTMIYSCYTCIVMLLWCAMTTTTANMLSARFCTGFSLGVLLATVPIYIAEVTHLYFTIYFSFNFVLFCRYQLQILEAVVSDISHSA